MKAEYTGETGHSAYTRIAEHEVDIYRGGNVRNAFVKHLAMHHPKEKKNPEAFKFKCTGKFSRCLDKQVAEI